MNVLEIFNSNNQIEALNKSLNQDTFSIYAPNCPSNHSYILAYNQFLKGESVVYVCSNTYIATLAYENLCHLAGDDSVSFYAVDEITTTELIAVSNDFRFERINVLKKLSEGIPQIIVTHIQAAIRPVMNFEYFKKAITPLRVGDDIKIQNFTRELINMGYRKTPTCEAVGEFSVRGEVLDIYPVFCNNPIRIDFFDTEIENIRFFDSVSQKSIEKVNEFTIYPVSDLIYDQECIDRAFKLLDKKEVNEKERQEIDELASHESPEKINKYVEYLYDSHSCFFDYVENKTVIFQEFNDLLNKYNAICEDIYSLGINNLNLKFYWDIYEILKNKKQLFTSEHKHSMNNINLDKVIDVFGIRPYDYSSNIKMLIEDIKLSKKQYYLILENSNRIEFIKNILKDNEIKFKHTNSSKSTQVEIVEGSFICFGFEDVVVLTEQELIPHYNKKKSSFDMSKYKTININSKDDIKYGDFVVHYEYGICLYKGLKTMELTDCINDYLELEFQDGSLYVPVDKIASLEKYIGSEGSSPKLSKLKGDEWKKRKEKVKSKVENIARQLIETEASRQNKKGVIYNGDKELLEEFDNDFEFEETPDQLEAINNIKKDMEEGKIIDRLVCGDVGYGKTEIAARASFHTVICSKQVAYLAPTTILSRQHYYTFKDRFEKYGIKVAMLNRLVSLAEQTKILNGLRNGTIDIVIGTHRLLSNDVKFKDLGLLVIDEEQRFGVKHKEKIKELKTDINVLTLTATPIPRTLQMSMMGIRQFSLINTPPRDRYPIQTYVLEYNDGIVKEAIYKELSRKGQVFYLHNNTSTIQTVMSKIKKMVPEARVCFAHGKMEKEEIEDIIQAFIDKEFDVLVCTTIIETGIDIPNSNTLIIDQADKLGLSQLYQIRGRIGRSDRIAYAYLMYPKNKVLTDNGLKRLNAIKEFTNLGSGYKIALRDLAIRGAGDILGSEQSGFIDMIGMEMYMKMLDEAINNLKGIEKKKEDKKYMIEVSKHISDSYVNDEEIKILIHEKINAVKTKEDKFSLIDELSDRFGKLKYETLLYIEERYLEGLLNKFDIDKINDEATFVSFEFPQIISNSLDGSKVLIQANKISNNFYFEYKNKKLKIKYRKQSQGKKWIFVLTRFLEAI